MNWEKVLDSKYATEPFEAAEKDRKFFTVYPPSKKVFRAFKLCSFKNTKVVILGQDPYHGKGQALGLAFAVPKDAPLQPSLKNIFKEIKLEYGSYPKDRTLKKWAEQGVLLLNTSLTVREGKPSSHSELGWHRFTSKVLGLLSKKKKYVVFMLWGQHAKAYEGSILNKKKHLILKASHPSPFSVKGFLGCNHFKEADSFLKRHSILEIDWSS